MRRLLIIAAAILALSAQTPASRGAAPAPASGTAPLPPASLAGTDPHLVNATTAYYPWFDRVLALRVGDVTGDGLRDVVATGWDGHVHILAQSPTCHGLQPLVDFPGGPGPVDLAIADTDGDSRNDIVILSRGTMLSLPAPTTVRIFRQMPDGFTAPPVTLPVGEDPRRVRVGDVTGDGRPDIVVSSKDNIDLLIQQPGGGYAASTIASPAFDLPYELAIADADGDGRNDIMLSTFAGSGSVVVRIFRQLPAGGFATPTAADELILPQVMGWVSGFAAGDVTGDGRTDVVVAINFNSAVLVLYAGKLGGGFAAPVSIPTRDNPVNTTIVDMDGDGRNDIVTLNDGFASYTVHYQSAAGQPGPANVVMAASFQSRWFTRDADVGDVTGDGRPDVVFGSFVSVGVATQGPAPLCPASRPPPASEPAFLYGYMGEVDAAAMVTGDVDGDGRADFVYAGNDGVGAVLHTADDRLERRVISTERASLQGLTVGDISGDGRLDIAAVAPFSDTLILLRQQPGGGFDRTAIPYPVHIAQALIADWNDDGRKDVAVTGASGLSVMLQNADSTLASPALLIDKGIGPTRVVAAADWNGDGRTDLVARWSDTPDDLMNVRVWLQQPGGGMLQLPPSSFESVTEPADIAVGDINGDGRPDIVMSDQRNASEARVVVIYQLPDGGLSTRAYTGDLGWDMPGGLAIADLNHDGRRDILVMNGWLYYSYITQNSAGELDRLRVNFALSGLNGYFQHRVAVIDDDGDGFPEAIGVATPDFRLYFLKPLNLQYHAALPLVPKPARQ